jgi:DNA-binding helix-hairpin-helix protein with protein kinase domain
MAYEKTLAEEMSRRRNSFRVAEQKLMDSERKWSSIADQYSGESRRIKEMITDSVREGRSLTTNYQTELKRLTGNAEAAARLRHLRLHLIADAEIPKIGAGRKQVLASHTVLTAADINEHVIREIGGFGEVLTSNLLTWKEGVLRQFYFNPATALSPAELRPVVATFRSWQQQILGDIDQNLSKLESLAENCRTSLKKLGPEIQRAVKAYDQARVDLSI